MTTMLIFTTGQSDVQLVSGGERQELDPNTCGTMHDQIEQRAWRVVDSPASKAPERAGSLPETPGELTLCTPKLDAVLRYPKAALPTVAVIFETRRSTRKDPRFAGGVLERRLLDHGVKRVRRHAFLREYELLEDPTSDVDAVVRRTIVDGLSSVIAEEIESARPEHVVLAATGGLTPANEVINELVRLHAVGRCHVTSLEVPDGALARRDDCAVEGKFHPGVGYRARWQALSLIDKGNMLGAWGAVSHLKDAPGQEWTRILEWLARFASSLPIPPGCDIAVLRHQRMSVRAALRVELALRAEDIPRAVHGTVAFGEAALWDTLNDYDFSAEGIAGSTSTGFELPRSASSDQKERFKRDKRPGINLWRVDDFQKGRMAWLVRLGRQRLSKLWEALDGEICDLRNDVAHNEPTPTRMESARQSMQTATLWSAKNTFLSQPLVQDVLMELGEPEPSKLLERLMADVRERLVRPDFATAAIPSTLASGPPG